MSLPLLNVGLMWVFPSLQSGSTGYQTLILPFPCSKCFGSILDGKQRALRSAGSTLERLHEALASLISTLIPFTVSFRCLCLWRWGRPLKYLGSPHVLKENPHLGCPSLLIPLGNPVGPDLPTTIEGPISFLSYLVLCALVCFCSGGSGVCSDVSHMLLKPPDWCSLEPSPDSYSNFSIFAFAPTMLFWLGSWGLLIWTWI